MVLFFDFANAFNEASRHRAYEEMRRRLPSLLPLFALLYGEPSKALIAKGISLGTIRTGVKQGCPLAMLAFCLCVHPLLKELQTWTNEQTGAWVNHIPNDYHMISDPKVMGYADDTRACVDPLLFTSAPLDPTVYSMENHSPWLQGCLERIARYGFRNHPDKMIALSKRQIPGLNDHIASVDNGAMDLGVPVGTLSFIQRTLQQKALKETEVLRTRDNAPAGGLRPSQQLLLSLNRQDSLTLVRMCVATRLHHLFRAVPWTSVNGHGHVVSLSRICAGILDTRMTKWLRHISNIHQNNLNDEPFELLRSISLGRGGLGIRAMAFAHGFYAKKLYADASSSLCSKVAQQHANNALDIGTRNAVCELRGFDIDNPVGNELWRQGAGQPVGYMGVANWEHLLYPRGHDLQNGQRVIASYSAFENTLLSAFRARVLEAPADESIAGLTTDRQREGALAIQLSIQSGNPAVFSRPGGNLHEGVSDKAFTRFFGFLFLQKAVFPHEILSPCCQERVGGQPIDLVDYPGHVLTCKKSQGLAVVRHNAVLDILVPVLERAVNQLDPENGEIRLEEDAKVRDVIESLDPLVVYGVTANRAQRGNDAARKVRPAGEIKGDILLRVRGKATLLDVVVCSPSTLKALAAGSHLNKGIAAAQRRNEKITKYAPYLPSGAEYEDVFEFVPLSIELGGYIDPPGFDWLSEFLTRAGMAGDLPQLTRTFAKSVARTTNLLVESCRSRLTQLAPEADPDPEAPAEGGGG